MGTIRAIQKVVNMLIIAILLIGCMNCSGQDTIKVEYFDNDPIEWDTDLSGTSGWTDSTFLLHGDGSNPVSIIYDYFTGLTPGQDYVVSGRHKGGADLAIIVEGVVILTLGTATEWTTFRVIFTADLDSQKVEFRGGNAGHIELDDIRIIISSGGALAITLLSFNAYHYNNQILIKWVTIDELNNDKFIIERTSDISNGIIYKNIGEVKGADTYAGELNYSLLDDNPDEGNNYYRLISIDFDGSREYTLPVAILYNRIKNKVTVYSINGKIVYQGTNVPDNLPNALYIINKLIKYLNQ